MKIELDELELLYIDDSLSCLRPNPFTEYDIQLVSLRDLLPGAKTTAFEDTILKIGSALIEITEKKLKTIEVNFEEDELWLLRELATSDVRVKDRALGYQLKLKVHKALQSLTIQNVLTNEGIEDADSTVEPMSHEDVKNLMNNFLKTDGQ